MKKSLVILFMYSILFYAPNAFTGEHGGKEHGGRKIKAQPTAQQIKDTMREYVLEKSKTD